MNISFWGAVLLLLLVAIVIVVFPLLRVRQRRSLEYKISNIQLHEEKLNELNLDLQESRIDEAAYKIAKQELDRELLEDASAESEKVLVAQAKKRPALALAIAVFLPTLSMLLYMQLGMQANSEQVTIDSQKTESTPSIEEMVVKLEQYLEANKGELKDWVMLGRTYKYLGRYGEAANAFAAANSIEPSPQVMLEQAEVLALLNDQKFNDESRGLVLKALEMAPDNLNTLWFAGVAEFQFGNYRKAIEHLSRLSSEAAQDPEVNRSLRLYIGKAREQLIAAGEEVALMDELLPVAPATIAQVPQVSLQVNVDVSDEVRKSFAETDVVFVYAKALNGPKMPLAAQRMTLADLPKSVVLDDSMGMVEGMNLSAFNKVVISARVSKTGAAIAQSGDYIGEVVVNDVASAGELNIGIDNRVP